MTHHIQKNIYKNYSKLIFENNVSKNTQINIFKLLNKKVNLKFYTQQNKNFSEMQQLKEILPAHHHVDPTRNVKEILQVESNVIKQKSGST